MNKILILRVTNPDNESLNTLIDSDDVCFPSAMYRMIRMIPVFNIIYNFWSQNNVQLDTVFESLKYCDRLLKKLQDAEKQGKRYINSCLVNHNEELGVIPAIPLRDMLLFYKKYRDATELQLSDSDISCLREYFYEFVRKNKFYDKNCRFNSVFFYENLGVAAMIAKNTNRRKSGKFSEVEIVEERSLGRYDRRWLDDIRSTCLFKECMESVMNYWEGKMTPNPKVEYLFSGKYILREL